MTKTVKAIRLTLLLLGSIIAIDCMALFALLKINFGTVVPFLIALIFLIHAIFWQAIQNLIAKRWQLKRAWQGCWLLFAGWLFSFVLFVVSIVKQINAQPVADSVEAIIVLGAGVNGDNPTPALANRLDSAAGFWLSNTASQKVNQPARIKAAGSKASITIVTAGGVGIGRTRSEASVMANYLVKNHGISAEHILKEEKSTSTEENLAFSKQLLADHGINIASDSIMLVTNDFHTIRAKAIGIRQGYGNVSTLASPTPLYILGNAWFREYFAYISGWLLDEY